MSAICFVLAPGQNHFFTELADVLRHELGALGVETSVSESGFPAARDGLAYCLIPPHEYFALAPPAQHPTPEQLSRTVLVCAEQPGQIHFRQNMALAARAGALFDISARAVRAYRRYGIRAEHLPLGYTQAWDHYTEGAVRPTDVLFLGAQTPRRARILSALAPALAEHEAVIVLSDNSRPNPGESATFLAGEAKWDALASSRILLNLHQGREPYFEWHRVLQSIHCGAAVLTEPSTDHAPLVDGEHFLSASGAELSSALAELAGDEGRRTALARDAYEAIRRELPMGVGAERLATAAADASHAGPRRRASRARLASRAASASLRGVPWRRSAAPGAGASAGEPAAGELQLTPAEGGALLVSSAQRLLPRAEGRLARALAESGASFAYGLVAAGDDKGGRNPEAVGNALPGSGLRPPVLISVATLGELGGETADPAAVLASLAARTDGALVRQFVAEPGHRSATPNPSG